MGTRTRTADRGRAAGRRLLTDVVREIELARANSGLSYAGIGRAVSLTGQQVGRICGGSLSDVGLRRLAEVAAVVGLDLHVRAFPGGPPIRDRAHLALLARLRNHLHPSLSWRTEVPVIDLAGTHDRRSWDATIAGPDWLIGVEAETRVVDVQALERRVHLKLRDGGVALVLVLNDTAHHQRLLANSPLRAAFPNSPRSVLRALGRGARPAGSAVLSL